MAQQKPTRTVKVKKSIWSWIGIGLLTLFILVILLVAGAITFWVLDNKHHQNDIRQKFAAAEQRCGHDPVAAVESSDTSFENVTTHGLTIYTPNDKEYQENKDIYSDGIFGYSKVIAYGCNLNETLNSAPVRSSDAQVKLDTTQFTSQEAADFKKFIIEKIKRQEYGILIPSADLPGYTLSSKTASFDSSTLTYNLSYTPSKSGEPLILSCLAGPLKDADGSTTLYGTPAVERNIDFKGPPSTLNNQWIATFGRTRCSFSDTAGELNKGTGDSFISSLKQVSADILTEFDFIDF